MRDPLASVFRWLAERPRVRLGVTVLLAAPAVWHVAAVIWVVSGRVNFPLQLEWLEGGEIYHAQRWLDGEAIYRRAASGFLPYPYPPLHALMLAGVGAVCGLNYTSARAVSVACFAVTAGVLTWRTLKHWPKRTRGVVGVVSLGWIAATYPMVNGWYDIARVDSAALVFPILMGAALDRERLRSRDLVSTGILGSLALYAKQTNVFAVLWVSALAVLREGKRAWVLIVTLGTLCVSSFAWLEWISKGAFAVWLFDTAHHALRPAAFGRYVWKLIVETPFLLAVPFALRHVGTRGRSNPSTRLWLGLLLAAVPASLLPFVKVGGASNTLIPLLVLAGPVTLMVAGDVLTTKAPNDGATASDSRRDAEPFVTTGPARIVALGLVVQALILATHVYDPRRFRPNREANDEARAFNRTIASLEGGVICPLDPYLPVLDGDRMEQAPWGSHLDAMEAKRPGVTVASYTDWLLSKRPRWVLLAGLPVEAPLLPAIEKHYSLARLLPMPSGQPEQPSHRLPTRLYERRADGGR